MTVARLAGVPVRLHWSLIVVAFALAIWVSRVGSVAMLPVALAGLVGLMLSVLAHELGHVAVARRFGIRTDEILLLAIGGAARMELRVVSPYTDLLVSLAGPAVSLLLGLTLTSVGLLWGWPALLLLGVANLVMGLFNLIPAFPMDGGRVLRAVLTQQLGATRANELTLAVGAVFALAAVLLAGWVGDASLGVLGMFLAAGQLQERRTLARLAGR